MNKDIKELMDFETLKVGAEKVEAKGHKNIKNCNCTSKKS